MAELDAPTLRVVPQGRLEIARVVHDLGSPITVIRGECLALERALDAATRERARVIEHEAQRIATRLRELAAVAPAPALSHIALDGLVLQAARRHAATARERRVRLVPPVPGPPVPVRGRAGDIERILDNLLANAIRHAAGEVRLAVAGWSGWAVVRVADDGPGVHPLDRDLIFQPGCRGRGAVGAGQGLGLAIARDLARDHGGTLALEGAGPGAVFRLALPLDAPDPSRAHGGWAA